MKTSTNSRSLQTLSGRGWMRPLAKGGRLGLVLAGAAVFAVTSFAVTRSVRADVIAGYVQGHGGLTNPSVDGDGTTTGSGSTAGGLGLQAGVRLLLLEAYGDHTAIGSGASITRGILGLRGAIGLGGWRLILRGGGGVIAERGGALTGRLDNSPDRNGVVARAGAALEKRLAPTVFGGIGLDGEVFNLLTNDGVVATDGGGRITGSNVFVSLHLKFELGI